MWSRPRGGRARQPTLLWLAGAMKSDHGISLTFSVLDKGNDHPPSKDWCVLLRTPPRPMHTANGAARRTLSTPTHARCWAPPCPNACAVAAPRQALRSSPSGSAIITSGRRDGPPESAMGAAGTFSTVGSIRELRVVPQHVGFVSRRRVEVRFFARSVAKHSFGHNSAVS